MHDRRKVEEALEALSLGFSIRQAAELVGASPSAVQARACGRLPHERAARRPDARPGGEPAAQGGVGRPKRGRLAPGLDVEQGQVRARREIGAGDGPAPALRHRFPDDLEELL